MNELQILLSLIPDDIRDDCTDTELAPTHLWVQICKGATARHSEYGDTLDLKIKGRQRDSSFKRKNGQYNYDGIWKSIRGASAFQKKLADEKAKTVKKAKAVLGQLKGIYACVKRSKSASITELDQVERHEATPRVAVEWRVADAHWGSNYHAEISDGEISLYGDTPWEGMTLEEKKTVLKLFAKAADRINKTRKKREGGRK